MATKPHPPLGDVSCRATGYTIQQFQRMGLPTAHLTRGLAYTLDDLQSHSASISWDDYLVFLRNGHSDLPANRLVELCTSYKGSPHLRPLLSAAGPWFHPARYFRWVADPESGAIRQLFRCVNTRFARVGEREVVVEEVIEPGFAPPPDIFWEAQSIAFGALTTHFGLGRSTVTWEPIEGGAAFRIRLPRRRPVRFALSWLASWFRRGTAELYGHERSLRLEREAAERTRAETALRESEERFRRITDAVPGLMYRFFLDPDGRQGFEFVSAGATGLSGYSPGELVARPELIWERMDPADAPAVRQSILDSARTGAPWRHEFRFRTKTGETRWARAHSVPEPATAAGRVVWNGLLTDVTAERRADAELRARDALLQKLSEQVPGFIYQYRQWPDGRSRFPYASEGIRDIYEVGPEEVRDSAEAVFARLHPDDAEAVAESIRRSVETLEPWQCEYRVRLPARGLRWLDGHAVPERMPDGSTLWHGHLRDVTDRKRAEDAVRESENRFRTLIEDLEVGVVLQDEADHILVSNGAAATTLGLTEDQLRGVTSMDPRWELVLEDGTPCPPDRVPSVLAARSRRPVRNAVLGTRHLQTGQRTWLQVNATPRLNADGSLRHVLVSLVDITDRKRAETELRQERDRLTALAATAPGVLHSFRIRADGTRHFAYVSPRISDIFPCTPEELERDGTAIRAYIHPDDFGRHAANIAESARTLSRLEAEYRVRHPSRGEIWVRAQTAPVREPDGGIIWHGFLLDVTERKRAEAALQLAERRQRLALDAGRMGTWDWEIGSDRLTWDDREQALFGFGAGEFDSRIDTFLNCVHPDDIAGVRRVLAAAAAGRDYDGEFRILSASGEVRWIQGSGIVVPRSDHSPPRMVGINYDITPRKRAEETVRRILDGIAPATGREFFRVLVDYLCEVCDVEFAFAGAVDPQNPNLVRTMAVSHRGRAADNFVYDLRGTPCEKVVGHTFCSHPTGVQQAFPADAMLVEMGIDAYLGNPLWSSTGHPLGLIVLLHNRPMPHPEQAGVVLKVVAARAGAELERQRADAALRESEERLRIFVESAPVGVAMLDRDLRYLSYSRRWLTDYGLGDQNLAGRSHYEVFPEITHRWKEIHRRCLTGVSERCERDRFERADGTVEYLRWEIQPWTDATGVIGGLVFFTEMITDRVRAEEQVRASLREKEAMLKEIHHRVKNNLQVISSLLSLQAARVTHPVAADVLAESQNRVRAMALVHETLYRSDDLARVDLSRYLGELCGYLFRSYGVDPARVRLELDVESVTVSLDKMIPCGLLVNEIVSNSLKHAFPGTRSGTVTVRGHTRPDGRLTLTLADDGIGLPADSILDHNQSLGLQLVNILAEQLGGQLAVDRSPSTRFVLSFSHRANASSL